MTKEERKLAVDLEGYETVELHGHTSVNGKRYWKVKHNGRAMMCLTMTLVRTMDKRGWVNGLNSLRTLNVLALRAALLDWQTRKEKRMNRKPRKKIDNEPMF